MTNLYNIYIYVTAPPQEVQPCFGDMGWGGRKVQFPYPKGLREGREYGAKA